MKNIVLYRVNRTVWFVAFVLEALLLTRALLKLLGANPGAWFTDLIYSLSSVPIAPFQYVFTSTPIAGGVFEWSALLAALVYWCLAWGIVKLIAMNRTVGSGEAEQTLHEEERM